MSERALQKANTAKNRRKQRLQACKSHRPHPQMEAKNAMQPVLCKIERISAAQLAEIAAQRDKNGLTYARHCDILQMEPPKERFRRAHNPKGRFDSEYRGSAFSDCPKQLADAPQQNFDRLRRIDTKNLHALTSSCRICASQFECSRLVNFVVLIIFMYYQLFDNKTSFRKPQKPSMPNIAPPLFFATFQ